MLWLRTGESLFTMRVPERHCSWLRLLVKYPGPALHRMRGRFRREMVYRLIAYAHPGRRVGPPPW